MLLPILIGSILIADYLYKSSILVFMLYYYLGDCYNIFSLSSLHSLIIRSYSRSYSSCDSIVITASLNYFAAS